MLSRRRRLFCRMRWASSRSIGEAESEGPTSLRTTRVSVEVRVSTRGASPTRIRTTGFVFIGTAAGGGSADAL